MFAYLMDAMASVEWRARVCVELNEQRAQAHAYSPTQCTVSINFMYEMQVCERRITLIYWTFFCFCCESDRVAWSRVNYRCESFGSL